MSNEDKRYYDYAIPIGEKEMREIVDNAHREYLTSTIPPRMDSVQWRAIVYMRALEQFLLKRGCVLQFKMEI